MSAQEAADDLGYKMAARSMSPGQANSKLLEMRAGGTTSPKAVSPNWGMSGKAVAQTRRFSPVQRVHLATAGMESLAQRQAQIRLQRSRNKGLADMSMNDEAISCSARLQDMSITGTAAPTIAYGTLASAAAVATSVVHGHAYGSSMSRASTVSNGDSTTVGTSSSTHGDGVPCAKDWLLTARDDADPQNDMLDLDTDVAPLGEVPDEHVFRVPSQARVAATPTSMDQTCRVERPKPTRPSSAVGTDAPTGPASSFRSIADAAHD